MSDLHCWNCDADVSDEPLPLSRHAGCDGCGEFLHCCRMCEEFNSDQPGGCANQLAEPPNDKTSGNFCEFFLPVKRENAGVANRPNADAAAQLNALFGDDEVPTQSANPLDDLFDD